MTYKSFLFIKLPYSELQIEYFFDKTILVSKFLLEMPTFNPLLQPVLDDLRLAHPLVRAGKMFGFPAYYAGKKLCACLYEQGVGLKLPAETAERLLREDLQVVLFQPFGRSPMRAWAQVDLPAPCGYPEN
ncbi:MAG: hypothetical protein GYA51_14085, partial [Candidatus Methanofastidiosa archaeon]|nr:hypothetical protein [Candidatus Methanofastidiosa archaeon]